MLHSQIIILALIQGITEFLPISSSAHLILPSQLLGWTDQGLSFDVAVHLGSLFAVITYYRKDLIQMIRMWPKSLAGEHSAESRLVWYIIIATIPAIMFGAGLQLLNLDNQLRNIYIIAGTTIIFGILLGWADRKAKFATKTLTKLNLRSTIFIGISQALALIPGTSRSGITMTATLMLGFKRHAAAKFSFLLSIPIIISAAGFQSIKLILSNSQVDWTALILGLIISMISAFACIHYFLTHIEKIGFKPFVLYRLLLGSFLLIMAYIY